MIDWIEGQLKETIEACTLNAYRLPQQTEDPEQLKQTLKNQTCTKMMANYINLEPEDQSIIQ